jgi:hypothetical protein
MTVLANILRVLNVVLAIGYVPLIWFRMRDSGGHYNSYLVGVWCLLVSIAVGSGAHWAESFNPAIPFCTAGLSIMILDSATKQRSDARKRRYGVPRDNG